MVEYNNKPILILSTPRTGSTPLVFEIAERLRKQNIELEIYSEPHYRPNKNEKLAKLAELIKNKDKNFILKIHIDDIPLYSNILPHLKSTDYFTMVRIRRKNVFKQIMSAYLEQHHRRKWFYKEKDLDIVDHIYNIHDKHITQTINYITRVNNQLSECEYNFDYDLFYEDLDFTTQHACFKSPKPVNYMELEKRLYNLLNMQGKKL